MIWVNRNTIITPYLALTVCEEEHEKLLKKHGLLHDNHLKAGRVTYIEDQNTMIVYIHPVKKVSDAELSIIAHESVHVFQFVCESMNEEKASSEFEAYSIQHIFYNLATN